MPDLFVHIGHSKTGTTTLQDHLFSKHHQIAYLGRPYKSKHLEVDLRRLVLQDSTQFDGSALKETIDTYRNGINNKTIVISEETFSTVRCIDRGIMAERIKKNFIHVRLSSRSETKPISSNPIIRTMIASSKN